MGARDKRRSEDNFPLNDPAVLRMRLFSDGLSLDMMFRKEKYALLSGAVQTFPSHSEQIP